MTFVQFVSRSIVAAGLLITVPGAALGNDIVLGYGSHYDEPYVVMEDGALVDGWVHMTARALSKTLQVPVSTIAIPRKRSSDMINGGDVDLYCFSDPERVDDMQSAVWSEKLFDVSNLVIAKNRVAKAIRSPYDLRGFFIGTITGDNHQPLTPFFERGQIQRVDTKSDEQNLKMLKNGRVEAVIISDAMSGKLLSRLGMADDYAAAPYVLSKRNLHCALGRSDRTKQDQLMEAIQDLKRSGVFDWPELAERRKG
jgi:ABC-type amino acid transport substrate-binding protein